MVGVIFYREPLVVYKSLKLNRYKRRLEASETTGSRKRRSVSAWSRIIMNQSPLYTSVSRPSLILNFVLRQWNKKPLGQTIIQSIIFPVKLNLRDLQIFSNSPLFSPLLEILEFWSLFEDCVRKTSTLWTSVRIKFPLKF